MNCSWYCHSIKVNFTINENGFGWLDTTTCSIVEVVFVVVDVWICAILLVPRLFVTVAKNRNKMIETINNDDAKYLIVLENNNRTESCGGGDVVVDGMFRRFNDVTAIVDEESAWRQT